MIEINRAALNSKYRGSGTILLRMFLVVFEYAQKHKLSIFFTTSITSLISMFIGVGIQPLPNIKFKYEPMDQNDVQAFLCKYGNHEIIISNIKHYLENYTKE